MRPARQHSRPRGGGRRQSYRRLFERLEQEEQRLKKHGGRCMAIQQSLLVRQPFFRKASHLWKTAYNPCAIISNNVQPICLFLRIFLEPIFFLLASHPILWPRLKSIRNFAYFGAVNYFNPEISIHIQTILKNNLYKYKIQIIVHA